MSISVFLSFSVLFVILSVVYHSVCCVVCLSEHCLSLYTCMLLIIQCVVYHSVCCVSFRVLCVIQCFFVIQCVVCHYVCSVSLCVLCVIQCVVCHSLCCLSFFGLRLLVTLLVS